MESAGLALLGGVPAHRTLLMELKRVQQFFRAVVREQACAAIVCCMGKCGSMTCV